MPQSRTTPVGTALEDGFSTKIALAIDPDISFWEKDVTPPGVDGGDAIEQTTHFNSAWRTFAPRSLKTGTDITVVAAYDPAVYSQIVAAININGLITVHFPDGSTLDVYGYLRTFSPGNLVEGTMPEATCTFTVTNVNPATGAEAAPVFTD